MSLLASGQDYGVTGLARNRIAIRIVVEDPALLSLDGRAGSIDIGTYIYGEEYQERGCDPQRPQVTRTDGTQPRSKRIHS